MIVLKFGGTSQKKKIYDLILSRLKSEHHEEKYIIVLSAVNGITNKLIEYVNQQNKDILKEIVLINTKIAQECDIDISDIIIEFLMEAVSAKTLDQKIKIISYGEYFTCQILDRYLKYHGINSELLSSYDLITSNLNNNISFYNKGEFNVDINKINLQNKVIIVPGFSGRTPDGNYCLLGRGGSDTSGSIIASAINADKYEIWTDVDGIYSSDPRKIKNTFINKNISYEVAQEIATMGAKVIHPYCILPCASKGIPIYIKNSFNPEFDGTIICNKSLDNNNNINGITIQDGVKIFKITSLNMWNNYGFVYDIFSVFKDNNVDVNIISTSQFNISTTTEESDENNIIAMQNKLSEKYSVEIINDCSTVSIVGDNIRMVDKIGEIFKLSKNYDIKITAYSSNDMTLSFVLSNKIALELAQELHDLIWYL